MLEKFIENQEITISKEDWDNLNSIYTKEQITNDFILSILNKQIKLPLRDITLEDAKSDFSELCQFDTSPLFKSGQTFTRYDYKYPISNLYLASNITVGNKASDYFQQYNRFLCDSINSPSPYRVWNSEKFLNSMLSALWTLNVKEVNSSVLRTLLSLRKYVASQFKPVIAKAIYTKFNSKVILDFSSGWGDRLCGFYSSPDTEFYLGIDPNQNVYNKYYEQRDFYDSCLNELGMKPKFSYFINSPAEDVDFYSKDYFDTIFTSPPYFQIERYTQEENQSFKRYKKIEEWRENFLFKTLEKVWYSLKRGGYLIINISDVYCYHTVNQICDPMNDFIFNELKCKKFLSFGMAMSKRPNSGALKDKQGTFIEPVWVWRKH